MKEFKIEEDLILTADDNAMDNMELIDILVEIEEGRPEYVGKFLNMLFGKEQKKKVYDYYRTDKGNVPVKKIVNSLEKVFKSSGDEEKN